MAGLYVFGVKSKDMSFLYYLLSAFFSLFIVVGLVAGITSCCGEDSTQYCEMVSTDYEEIYVYGDNFTDGLHWIHGYPPNPNLIKDIYLFHIERTNTYNEICVDKEIGLNAFSLVLKLILIFFYTVLALGLIVISQMDLAEKNYNGGFDVGRLK